MALPSAAYPAALIPTPGEINTGKDGGKLFETITPADLTIPGDHLNTLAVELRATQTELGTDPAGSKTDLKTRLAVSVADDGSISAMDKVAFAGVISPSQITGDQNNYAPTGIATANTLRLTADAARSITGLSAGASGEIKVIHNIGSYTLTLKNESSSSTAANRFALQEDLELYPGSTVALRYDATSSRWRSISGWGAVQTKCSANLLLNGCFENVLYGTHTAAITTHGVASTVKNTQFPGWQGVTPAGSPSMSVTASTTIGPSGAQSCKVSSVTLGSGSAALCLEQRWNATHYIEFMAAACRGLYLTFALHVKLVNQAANACRIGISVDGGSNYTYSSYKANDTSWERLLVSVAVGASATDVRFRISMEAGSTIEYYFDNGMVSTSAIALTALPFVPRLPVRIKSEKYAFDDTADLISGGGVPDMTACDSGGVFGTALSLNSVRPHWANEIEFCTTMYFVNSTQKYMKIAPNGSSNRYYFEETLLGAGAYHAGFGICTIGQDGLVALGNGNDANLAFYLFLKNFVGVDL